MNEYQQIVARYKKYKQYEWKVLFVSIGLLILASIFVSLDLIRINPFVVYLFAMGVALYYAWHIRVETKNFYQLKRFLKKHDVETLKDKELLFFIDYQLTHAVNQKVLDVNAHQLIETKQTLSLIKNYYNHLKDGDNQETTLTLIGYQTLIEQEK